MPKFLYLITDGGQLRAQGKLIPSIKEILKTSSEIISHIQLREQVIGGEYATAEDSEIEDICRDILPLCREAQVKLLVNRNIELVKKLDLDGVHLGGEFENITKAREILGAGREIGFSVHSVEDVLKAEKLGADYNLLSPIFSPTSKKTERESLGLEVLRQASDVANKPLIALGGITAENAKSCLEVGANGVASLGYVFLANDPAKTVLEF